MTERRKIRPNASKKTENDENVVEFFSSFHVIKVDRNVDMITLGSRWMFSLIITTCVRLMRLSMFVFSCENRPIRRDELVKLKRSENLEKNQRRKSLHVSHFSLPSEFDGAGSSGGRTSTFFWHLTSRVDGRDRVMNCQVLIWTVKIFCCVEHFENLLFWVEKLPRVSLDHSTLPATLIVNSKSKLTEWCEKQICEIFNKLCSSLICYCHWRGLRSRLAHSYPEHGTSDECGKATRRTNIPRTWEEISHRVHHSYVKEKKNLKQMRSSRWIIFPSVFVVNFVLVLTCATQVWIKLN